MKKETKNKLCIAAMVVGGAMIAGSLSYSKGFNKGYKQGYDRGYKNGESNLVEELINICESGSVDGPTFTSDNLELKGLIYELQAIRIGD